MTYYTSDHFALVPRCLGRGPRVL